jgi:hypothetical protein
MTKWKIGSDPGSLFRMREMGEMLRYVRRLISKSDLLGRAPNAVGYVIGENCSICYTL